MKLRDFFAPVVLLILAITSLWHNAAYAGPRLFYHWQLSEAQPNIANGGRASTISVHPADPNQVIVASESGGLFKSFDRGVTWRHIDSFRSFGTFAVTYLPSDPNVIFATTGDDFGVAGGGGVWRSTDGGSTWAQASISIPALLPANTRLSAFEISLAPDSGDAYVASTWGILISRDRGSTWAASLPAPFAMPVFSVTALSGGVVLAGGYTNYRSTDSGRTWTPMSGLGSIFDIHALARSPLHPQQAYAAVGGTQLSYTEDSGVTWTAIPSAPAGGGGCGGIAFVKAKSGPSRVWPFPARGRSIVLHYGNRCGVATLVAPALPFSTSHTYTGAWTAMSMDHGDARDLAFDSVSGSPMLMGSDGGLHATNNGGASWTFTGGGVKGYNALQITEVQSQWIQDSGYYDLYFGTQDNDNWSSSDDGATWQRGPCCEGFFIELMQNVATASNSIVTFVACGACYNGQAGRLFTFASGWMNPPGAVVGNPKIIGTNSHIQGVNPDSGFPKGFARTNSRGAAWSTFAAFDEDRRDIPKMGRAPSGILSLSRKVIYQPINVGWYPAGGFEKNQLVRITDRFLGRGVSVAHPAMTNFGGLGINPTMFAWYQVFGVAPTRPWRLIAPDVVNQRMMRSEDFGETWQEMPMLTDLVTDHGRLLFSSNIFPEVSAVSYSPYDDNYVAIGTRENGIFLSSDGGENWQKVDGSEQVTFITSFTWKNSGELYVSTYGRGLWRLEWISDFRIPDIVAVCVFPCKINPHEVPDWKVDPGPDWMQAAIIATEGRLNGAKFENGRLAALYLSPDAAIATYGGMKLDEVKLVRTDKWNGLEGSKTDLREFDVSHANLRGFVVDLKGEISATITSPAALNMLRAPEEKQMQAMQKVAEQNDSKQSEQKSTRVEFGGGHLGQPNVFAAGEPIAFSVVGSEAKGGFEILVDGNAISKLESTGGGKLVGELKAPERLGMHSLVLRDGQGNTLTGANFLVVPLDKETDEPSGDPQQEEDEPLKQ